MLCISKVRSSELSGVRSFSRSNTTMGVFELEEALAVWTTFTSHFLKYAHLLEPCLVGKKGIRVFIEGNRISLLIQKLLIVYRK